MRNIAVEVINMDETDTVYCADCGIVLNDVAVGEYGYFLCRECEANVEKE